MKLRGNDYDDGSFEIIKSWNKSSNKLYELYIEVARVNTLLGYDNIAVTRSIRWPFCPSYASFSLR